MGWRMALIADIWETGGKVIIPETIQQCPLGGCVHGRALACVNTSFLGLVPCPKIIKKSVLSQ